MSDNDILVKDNSVSQTSFYPETKDLGNSIRRPMGGMADGANVTLGAKADAAWDGTASTPSAMGLFKYLGAKLEAVRVLLASTLTVSGNVAVSNLPTTQPVSGTVATTVSDGSNVSFGARADSVWDGAASTISAMSLYKYMGAKLEAIRVLLAGTLPVSWRGTYTAAGVTLTDGQTAAPQFDSAGHLLVANQLTLGGQAPGASAPTVNADQYAQYETVAASATAQAMGASGAIGDYLAGVMVFPGTAGCGVVTIIDGANTLGTFPGGGTTPLPSLIPFLIPVGTFSTNGAWKITTGANVTAVGIGKFT